MAGRSVAKGADSEPASDRRPVVGVPVVPVHLFGRLPRFRRCRGDRKSGRANRHGFTFGSARSHHPGGGVALPARRHADQSTREWCISPGPKIRGSGRWIFRCGASQPTICGSDSAPQALEQEFFQPRLAHTAFSTRARYGRNDVAHGPEAECDLREPSICAPERQHRGEILARRSVCAHPGAAPRSRSGAGGHRGDQAAPRLARPLPMTSTAKSLRAESAGRWSPRASSNPVASAIFIIERTLGT